MICTIVLFILLSLAGVYPQEPTTPSGNSENGKKGQELYIANSTGELKDIPVIFSEVTYECSNCSGEFYNLYSFPIKLKKPLETDPTKFQWLGYVLYFQEHVDSKMVSAYSIKAEEKEKNITINSILDYNIHQGFKEMISPYNGEKTEPRIKAHKENIYKFIKDKHVFNQGPNSKIISPNGRIYQCTNCTDVEADIFFPVKIDDKDGIWKNFLVYLKTPDNFDSVKNEESGVTIDDIIEKEKEKMFKLII